MVTRESVDELFLDDYQDYVKPKLALRKKKQRGTYGFFFVCVAIGGLIGGIGTPILIQKAETEGYEKSIGLLFLVGLVWFLISSLMHIFIHEAGHLVFGLMTGYRFLSYRVFSFAVVKKNEKFAMKKLKVAGTAGQCLMYPPKWEEDKPFPYALYNLGGGFLNILSGLPFVPLFFCGNEVLIWGAGIFIAAAVIMAASNLIPLSVPMPNDGKNFLMCKKSRENQRSLYRQLQINAELSDGKSIRDLDEKLFVLPENADLAVTLTGVIRMLDYYRYLVLEDYEKAKKCLLTFDAYEEKMPIALINMLDIERLYLMLHEKAPISQMASVYRVIGPVFRVNVSDLSVLRVKHAYAILLTEEEREQIEWLSRIKKEELPKKLKGYLPLKAEKIYEIAGKIVAKHPVIGEAEFQMELIERDRKRVLDTVI